MSAAKPAASFAIPKRRHQKMAFLMVTFDRLLTLPFVLEKEDSYVALFHRIGLITDARSEGFRESMFKNRGFLSFL